MGSRRVQQLGRIWLIARRISAFLPPPQAGEDRGGGNQGSPQNWRGGKRLKLPPPPAGGGGDLAGSRPPAPAGKPRPGVPRLRPSTKGSRCLLLPIFRPSCP